LEKRPRANKNLKALWGHHQPQLVVTKIYLALLPKSKMEKNLLHYQNKRSRVSLLAPALELSNQINLDLNQLQFQESKLKKNKNNNLLEPSHLKHSHLKPSLLFRKD
jgi:hypothetical protein